MRRIIRVMILTLIASRREGVGWWGGGGKDNFRGGGGGLLPASPISARRLAERHGLSKSPRGRTAQRFRSEVLFPRRS